MKTLIVIRHGAYDDKDSGLNDLGKRQMEKAGDFLSIFLKDKQYKFVSSNGPRAQEGAKIIAEKLGTTFDIQEGLLVVEDFDFETVLDELPKVIISRGKFVEMAGEYFSNKFNCQNPVVNVDKGESFALVCNLENNRLSKIDFI